MSVVLFSGALAPTKQPAAKVALPSSKHGILPSGSDGRYLNKLGNLPADVGGSKVTLQEEAGASTKQPAAKVALPSSKNGILPSGSDGYYLFRQGILPGAAVVAPTLKSAADTANLHLTETALQTVVAPVTQSAADTANLHLTETALQTVVAVTQSAADTANLHLTETALQTVVTPVTQSAADTANLHLTETALQTVVTPVTQSAADTTNLHLTETAAMVAVSLVSSADLANLHLVESASILSVVVGYYVQGAISSSVGSYVY
jgi:hypothetical protein